MNAPIEIPTRGTVEFIAAQVPPGARILEVGCGAGHVAAELLRRGYRVTGIDSDLEALDQARAQGVPVLQARWPECVCPPVDAIVFTRSLHHIPDLPAAVTRAREILRADGTLLIEDFAFDAADFPTIRWFLDILRSSVARALITPVPGEFVTRLLTSRDPEAEWPQAHDHGLHTAASMSEAVARQFSIREAREVAYLYRYLVPVLPATAAAAEFLGEVLADEIRLGELRRLRLVGRRLVATRPRA